MEYQAEQLGRYVYGVLGWVGLCQVGNRQPHYKAIILTPAPFFHLRCLKLLHPL